MGADCRWSMTCYICGAELPNDPALVHVAIDLDAMEAAGLRDVSEITDEAVLMQVCSVCGTREDMPTMQELRDAVPPETVQ